MERVKLTGGALPGKVNLERLQAEVDASAGAAVPILALGDPETGAVLSLVINLPEGVDRAAVEAAIKAHAPARTDREELEQKIQQETDRKAAESGLSERIDDLERRMEALERGSKK